MSVEYRRLIFRNKYSCHDSGNYIPWKPISLCIQSMNQNTKRVRWTWLLCHCVYKWAKNLVMETISIGLKVEENGKLNECASSFIKYSTSKGNSAVVLH